MFKFGRKPEMFGSQEDCDNQKLVANILFKLNERGISPTLSNLDVFIPGIKDSVKKETDKYIEEQYKKGVSPDILLKQLVPEKEKELLQNKAISALLEFKVRCNEYNDSKKEQKGGKSKSVKGKTRKIIKKKVVKRKLKKM